MMITPVILSGGSGTRLWPLSRELQPKQFLPVVGDETLFQETAQRLSNFISEGEQQIPVQPPIVVCNEGHRFLVAEQMREINIDADAIILEPTGRNTAPALTTAALHAESQDPEAVLLVMPADHVIKDSITFHRVVQDGYACALDGALVTFGIVPTSAETGFGYIRVGDAVSDTLARTLAEFVEKPDLKTAETYLAHGGYLWNSGMFMLKASVWLKAIKHFNPDILSACRAALSEADVDADFIRLDSEQFAACPSDSIDYAVMEKVVGGEGDFSAVVIPLDAGWSDVGSWPALWDIQEKDESGNVTKGDVLVHNSHDSLLLSHGRLLTAVGVDNLVVVETPDAVLVGHKDSAQDVKLIAQQLKRNLRDEHAVHSRIHRPWGNYECIDFGERYQVKRITVNPGASLSLQVHYHRAEHWIVVTGTAKVISGDKELVLGENQSTYIPLGVTHRLENPGSIPLEMIEVQSGSYLGEDDIVRFDDRYGRS